MTKLNNNKDVIVKPEDVRRAREFWDKWRATIYDTSTPEYWEAIKNFSIQFATAYSAAETKRLMRLLAEIAQVVAAAPTVTNLQTGCVQDHSLIPMAIRDWQSTTKDVLKRSVREREAAEAESDRLRKALEDLSGCVRAGDAEGAYKLVVARDLAALQGDSCNTDLNIQGNQKHREEFERSINAELKENAALWTEDEIVFIRRRYLNPFIQKRWEEFQEGK